MKRTIKRMLAFLLATLMVLPLAGVTVGATWTSIINVKDVSGSSSSGYSETFAYTNIKDSDYLHVPFKGAEEKNATTSNWDQAATLKHSAFGYDSTRANNKVVLEVDYRPHYDASIGGNPSLECQFERVTPADKTNIASSNLSGNDVTYISLFKILLKTGQLTQVGTIVSTEGLVLDEWNTITLVLDLDAGTYNTYVNGTLYAKDGYVAKGNDDQNVEKISVAANKFIFAKCNKNSGAFADAEATAYSYVDIDNISIYTLDEEEKEISGLYSASYTVKGSKHTSTHTNKVFDRGDGRFSHKNAFDILNDDLVAGLIAPVQGASARISNASGLRFVTQIDVDKLNALKDIIMPENGDQIAKSVGIGTMIAPKDYVEAVGAFTIDAFQAAGKAYLEVDATVGSYWSDVYGSVAPTGDYDALFAGSITNIKLGNRNRDFSAVGYIKITLNSGETVYAYSYDYSSDTIGNYSRSVEYIADCTWKDKDQYAFDDKDLATIETLKTNKSEMTTPYSNTGSAVTDVLVSPTELYFKVGGVYCRMTYNGYNGWRLQANATSYNAFNEMGAAQSLSTYLGEQIKDQPLRISAAYEDGLVTVTNTDAENGTKFTLNLNTFEIKFYNALGVETSNVTSITVAGNKVTMKGDLTANEAIFGGGERFDTTNRRGTLIDLYTSDCYDQGGGQGTYMAIPLFSTSRGAGIFVNRYEQMTADFGYASSNVWEVVLDNELMDSYFYATGAIEDVIAGYTALSGTATLPEEWMQGVLITRYGPDFGTFEEDKAVYDSFEAIPSTLYRRAGTSSDNYTYTKVTQNSDVANDANGTIYCTESKGSYTVAYRKVDNTFVRTTKKGSPSGYSIKTIVENLLSAGMKPTAVISEAWGYATITSDATKLQDTKDLIAYLHENDIMFMPYMSVGGSLASGMKGYKAEYVLTATHTIKTDAVTNGVLAKSPTLKSETITNEIRATSGSGTNPDMSSSNKFKYLDITNPAAVEWFFDTLWQELIELGVDGIKIDFCEEMPDEHKEYELDVKEDNVWVEREYHSFDYHWYDSSVFEDDNIHHSYPSYMISLFYSEMNKRMKEYEGTLSEGFMVLSRGGGIGSQRNPYIWAGDQARTYSSIAEQLIAVINSGLSGVPFVTYDMAGYAYSSTKVNGSKEADGNYYQLTVRNKANNTSYTLTGDEVKNYESEIFARAIEYTAFTSTIQTHGDVRHAYEMTDDTQTIYKEYVALHNALLPYIQQVSKVACENGTPVVRHLVLEYQKDTNVYSIDDQFMLGDALLVAPVVDSVEVLNGQTFNGLESATSRDVYLPANEYGWVDLNTNTYYKGGQTLENYEASLDQIPVFLNVDSADAEVLAEIFNGDAWQAINGGVQIDVPVRPTPSDPVLPDIFA